MSHRQEEKSQTLTLYIWQVLVGFPAKTMITNQIVHLLI